MDSTLDEITIYIPTINRPHYLERCLAFLSQYGVRLKIVVFDSSTELNKLFNLTICEEYSNLDIDYLWEGSLTIQFQNMGHMIEYVLKNRVTTEFVVFCGDDDFLFVHNLTHYIDFLKQYKDYIVCHGNIVLIKEENKKFRNCGVSTSMDLPQDDPLERFTWYALNGSSIQYGVSRTADCLAAFSFSSEIKHKWFATEFLPTVILVLDGKIKNLSSVGVLQEWGHPEISFKSDHKNWLFKMINTDLDWTESFVKVVDIFMTKAMALTNKSEDEIYKVFENGFSYRICHTLDLEIRDWFEKNADSYYQHHLPLSHIGKTKANMFDKDIMEKILTP